MDFSTTITHESQTAPGVTFTVRRLNLIARAARESKMLPARARYSDIFDRIRTLAADPDASELRAAPGRDGEFNLAWAELIHLENSEIRPAYIRAGLVAVEGMTIDGAPVTVETFLNGAPDALLVEAFVACRNASDLTEEQRKNSEPPTTSGAVADGGNLITIAPTAAAPDTTPSATAAGPTPAAPGS